MKGMSFRIRKNIIRIQKLNDLRLQPAKWLRIFSVFLFSIIKLYAVVFQFPFVYGPAAYQFGRKSPVFPEKQVFPYLPPHEHGSYGTVSYTHLDVYKRQDIKRRLLNGEIGDIINLQLTEHVSYHHLAVSYIRGKWGNEEACGAPMLLAKCCHDIDLIMWLKSGIAPKQVASFGSDFQFSPEKKPKGAGKRCLTDCAIEDLSLIHI